MIQNFEKKNLTRDSKLSKRVNKDKEEEGNSRFYKFA